MRKLTKWLQRRACRERRFSKGHLKCSARTRTMTLEENRKNNLRRLGEAPHKPHPEPAGRRHNGTRAARHIDGTFLFGKNAIRSHECRPTRFAPSIWNFFEKQGVFPPLDSVNPRGDSSRI